MRLLVACSQCERRYNAAERKIGTRFRCHCGEVLTVRQPRGHNSEVVRCSSCGGGRAKGENSCGYCGADFTLHERDLNTVCPKCLSRVSDKAKYCSHCATILSAEMMAGVETKHFCPACGKKGKLQSRRLGREKISVLECQSCTGLWLGTESFKQLRDRVAEDASHLRGAFQGKPKPQSHVRQPGPLYRNCAICKNMMGRKQYSDGSGVIIDFCRDHGIWFDAHELHQILDWIAKGGQAPDSVSRLSEEEIVRELNRNSGNKPVIGRWTPGSGLDSDYNTGMFDIVLGGLFGGFSDLLD